NQTILLTVKPRCVIVTTKNSSTSDHCTDVLRKRLENVRPLSSIWRYELPGRSWTSATGISNAKKLAAAYAFHPSLFAKKSPIATNAEHPRSSHTAVDFLGYRVWVLGESAIVIAAGQ